MELHVSPTFRTSLQLGRGEPAPNARGRITHSVEDISLSDGYGHDVENGSAHAYVS